MSLHLRDTKIALPTQILLSGFRLTVGPGEIVTLMGPSGCGKSILLSYLTGHLPPTVMADGQVLIGDERVDLLPPEQRRLGILFQDDLLFPHMSLGENLMFAVPNEVSGKTARRDRAEEALGWAKLDGFFERNVETLSGGQRRRAALMRALLAEPNAMLLDEPFSELDEDLRQEIRGFTFHHLRQRRIPSILVTHDMTDANAAGGRLLRPWSPLSNKD